jgi:hypothetical protein
MPRTVTALYEDFMTARRVADELAAAGIPHDGISVLANDATGQYATSIRDTVEHRGMPDDEEISAEQGAGFGMIVGALVGLGAMVVPGIGPVIAAGPLVSALIGAGVGAVAGGVTGGVVAGLMNMGIPEEDVEFYAEGVRRGGALVIARTPDERLEQAVAIMRDHNPVNLQQRADYWRQSGWSGFDDSAAPYTTQEMSRERASYPRDTHDEATERVRIYPAEVNMMGHEQADLDAYRDDFYTHYWGHFGNSGRSFEDYLPAYEYGYRLANDQRYSDLEWTRLEPRARLYWEDHYEGAWEDFKDAVGYAWNRVKTAVS